MRDILKKRFSFGNRYLTFAAVFLFTIVFSNQLQSQTPAFSKKNAYHFKSDSLFENRASLDLSKFIRWEEEFDDKGRSKGIKSSNSRTSIHYGEHSETIKFYDQNDRLFQYLVLDSENKSRKLFKINKVQDTIIVSTIDTMIINDSLMISKELKFENGDTMSFKNIRTTTDRDGTSWKKTDGWSRGRKKVDILLINSEERLSDFLSTSKKIRIENGDTTYISTNIDTTDKDGITASSRVSTFYIGQEFPTITKDIIIYQGEKTLRIEEYFYHEGQWDLKYTETRTYDEFGRKLFTRRMNTGAQPVIDYYRYE